MHNLSDNGYSHSHSAFYLRGDDSGRNGAHIADIGELQHSSANVFHQLDLTRISAMYNAMKASNTSVLSANLHFGGLNNSICSAEIGSSGQDAGEQLKQQKGGIMAIQSSGAATSVNGQSENWGDSGVVAHHSHQTDTSTNSNDKNQFPGGHHDILIVTDSTNQSKEPIRDQKALSKLALNREAAKKSRMRKKAYVQQLESSSQRLTKLEHDLKKARRQGIFGKSGFCRDHSQSIGGGSCVAFDVEYTHWMNEHQRLITDLRLSVNSHLRDTELQLVVESVMSHYDELYRLKSSAAKSDIFHILSGTWKTPAERCFMWLGGFRSSDLLKVLGKQIEPLTEQQLVGICDLQKSSQQAEDALSQGMEALQQSVFETLSNNSLASCNGGNMVDYMGQMAMAMSKIATVENFLHQADLLRLQTLQQLQRILTTRQAARALLAISDYKSRIRALSSLWLARPNV